MNRFRAAFEGPYTALGMGAFSCSPIDAAEVLMAMNLGVFLEFLSNGTDCIDVVVFEKIHSFRVLNPHEALHDASIDDHYIDRGDFVSGTKLRYCRCGVCF